MRKSCRRGLCVLFLAGVSGNCLAEEKPLWEIGFGFFALSSPDYRGAEQSHQYLLPLPYLIYRGDFIKIDRAGIYSRLFASPRLNLDLSADGSVPADSSRNRARAGMPDLDAAFELGPVLEVCLWENCAGDRRLQFRLPVRAVFTTDFGSIDSRGSTVYPHLNLDIMNIGPEGGWNFGIAAGPLFASELYHAYYYDVTTPYVTASRPAYTAHGGYSGNRYTITLSKRFRQLWVGSFVRYDSLAGAVFADSPLVLRDHAFMAGFSVAWLFFESSQRVNVKN